MSTGLFNTKDSVFASFNKEITFLQMLYILQKVLMYDIYQI